MWTTVALLGVVTSLQGQANQLAFSNIRTTYGVLGVPRDNSRFLPGDRCVLAFDVDGFTADESGKVHYSIALEVTDDRGRVKFRQEPKNREAKNSLGGRKVPAYVDLQIGLDQPKGNYQVKATVTDLASKASRSLLRSFDVVAPNFGLVRLTTTADAGGQYPLPFPCEGQTLWVNFGAVGFERDRATGQPNLAVSLTVRDDEGRETLPKPLSGAVTKDVPKKARGVPMQFMLELNRAGKFTVDLKAVDKVTGKQAKLSFPLTVLKAR
jgi:hypothetical protein